MGDYVSGLNEKKQNMNNFRQNQNTNYKLHKKIKTFQPLNWAIENTLTYHQKKKKSYNSCNLMISIFHFLIKWNILLWFDTMMIAMWALFSYIHTYLLKQYLLKMKARHAIKDINLWRLQGTKYFTIPAVAHWWYR